MCACKQKKGAVQAVIAFPVGQRVSKNTTYMCFGCGYWDRARCMCSPLHVCLCGKQTSGCGPSSFGSSPTLLKYVYLYLSVCQIWARVWQTVNRCFRKVVDRSSGKLDNSSCGEAGEKEQGERREGKQRGRGWEREWDREPGSDRDRQSASIQRVCVCIYIYTHSHRGRLSAEHTVPRGEAKETAEKVRLTKCWGGEVCHLVDLDGMYAFSFNAHVCLGKFALCMSILIFVPIYMQFYTVFESFPLCFTISCRVCQLLLLYSVRMGGVEM